MSWRDEPASYRQQIALRNALDHRYGMWQGREEWERITKDGLTKGQASDELAKIYRKEKDEWDKSRWSKSRRDK